MIVAIRSDELFLNWSERYSEVEITTDPYNYTLVDVPDSIDCKNLQISDFVGYVFNMQLYNNRMVALEESNYSEKVALMIRTKYSINDELSILRQKVCKPEEFDVYNAFCEECKSIIKNM